jgi:hypothetical protein
MMRVPPRRTSGPASTVLVKLMRSQQEALKRAFEAATLYSHPGIIGSKREDGVRKFLQDHLPQSLGVVKGQAVDYQVQRLANSTLWSMTPA